MSDIPCEECSGGRGGVSAGWGRRDPETGRVVDAGTRCPACNPRPEKTAVYVDRAGSPDPNEKPTSEVHVPNPLNQQPRP